MTQQSKFERPGPLFIRETKADYDFRMKWNACGNDGHLSPHATTPSTGELKATSSAGSFTANCRQQREGHGQAARAIDPFAATFDNGPIPSTDELKADQVRAHPSSSPALSLPFPLSPPPSLPKSEKAAGKQRAVDPMAAAFDNGATRMVLGDITNVPFTRSGGAGTIFSMWSQPAQLPDVASSSSVPPSPPPWLPCIASVSPDSTPPVSTGHGRPLFTFLALSRLILAPLSDASLSSPWSSSPVANQSLRPLVSHRDIFTVSDSTPYVFVLDSRVPRLTIASTHILYSGLGLLPHLPPLALVTRNLPARLGLPVSFLETAVCVYPHLPLRRFSGNLPSPGWPSSTLGLASPVSSSDSHTDATTFVATSRTLCARTPIPNPRCIGSRPRPQAACIHIIDVLSLSAVSYIA
ncbi:hypothetical protein B0H19DRAFT_1381104 [Mycena capillaripes]|nr:hypothetical protein B0H19DRAFT_1381104 [Mycena capillaripes]